MCVDKVWQEMPAVGGMGGVAGGNDKGRLTSGQCFNSFVCIRDFLCAPNFRRCLFYGEVAKSACKQFVLARLSKQGGEPFKVEVEWTIFCSAFPSPRQSPTN
ncbi:unnamed protein product [Hydatigera taeniaeformis]|uniref:Secreted protein n=1 Tax=Hydatigena taeniaeformis TaxID=6205 RepID=A0A0R3WYX0_HYDTA|nr:unnamed protein product [Hydatigera taeniaeformis]